MADSAEPQGRPQIMLVEDEPLIRMLAAEMLDQLGFGAVEAGCAAEALALTHRLDGVDALMIDLGLPDQPGENVIRALRLLRPDLPVIVTTGADTAAAASRLDDCAQLTFLEKPYYFNDLKVAIANIAVAG